MQVRNTPYQDSITVINGLMEISNISSNYPREATAIDCVRATFYFATDKYMKE